MESLIDMIQIPPYNAPVISGVYIYTVDKVWVKPIINETVREFFSDNITALNSYIMGLHISEEDTRSYHYRYSCYKDYYNDRGEKYAQIEIKMLQNNTEGDDCCRIIFNPNKFCNSEECISDLNAILSLADAYYVEMMDIAIDIPTNKEKVHLVKDKRVKLDCSNTKWNQTEYLGKNRNTIGHVKLYDKQSECKLSNELTRLEITVGNPLEKSWLNSVSKRLPKVIISAVENEGTSLSANLNDTEKVIVLALIDSPKMIELWKKLGYKMKKKIEPYIFADDIELEYDMEAIQKVANNIIETIKIEGTHIKGRYITSD